MPTELHFAYFAGVFDSDGYITIQRSTHKGRLYFGPQIGIAGTQRAVHDEASSLWGGKVSAYTPKNPRHRVQFQWSRSGDAAAEIIRAVMPYLRLKHEQARIALELWEHLQFGKGDDPYPWMGPGYDATQLSNEFREAIAELNQWRRDGRTWDEMPTRERVS